MQKQQTTLKRIRYTTFLKKFMGDPARFYLSESTVSEVPPNTDMNLVWTVLEVDGRQLIVNGRHFVNRDGYLISKVPHNGQDFEVFGVYNGIEKA
jgi:hypothetical protein